MHKIVNGIQIELTEQEILARQAEEQKFAAENAKIQYQINRRNEYPNLTEQLDMLYKDMVNGTSNWKDLITSIKLKYPKE